MLRLSVNCCGVVLRSATSWVLPLSVAGGPFPPTRRSRSRRSSSSSATPAMCLRCVLGFTAQLFLPLYCILGLLLKHSRISFPSPGSMNVCKYCSPRLIVYCSVFCPSTDEFGARKWSSSLLVAVLTELCWPWRWFKSKDLLVLPTPLASPKTCCSAVYVSIIPILLSIQ